MEMPKMEIVFNRELLEEVVKQEVDKKFAELFKGTAEFKIPGFSFDGSIPSIDFPFTPYKPDGEAPYYDALFAHHHGADTIRAAMKYWYQANKEAYALVDQLSKENADLKDKIYKAIEILDERI